MPYDARLDLAQLARILQIKETSVVISYHILLFFKIFSLLAIVSGVGLTHH